tara:strand:+ start:512 stop:694 length:183 start_codon:yes stop_codon:yes gene_type:complete
LNDKINIPSPILISAGITGSGLGEKLEPVGLQDIMKAAKIKRKFFKIDFIIYQWIIVINK